MRVRQVNQVLTQAERFPRSGSTLIDDNTIPLVKCFPGFLYYFDPGKGKYNLLGLRIVW